MCPHKPKPTHDLKSGHQPKLPNLLCRLVVMKMLSNQDGYQTVPFQIPQGREQSTWLHTNHFLGIPKAGSTECGYRPTACMWAPM